MKCCFALIAVFYASSCSSACGEEAGGALRPWLTHDWPQADQLFQRDRHWVGGDGGYSIDLSESRVLWLFGDSWIDSSGTGTRAGAAMVSNSVAIQRGYDPSKATIRFFWGGDASHPKAFFSDNKQVRYWPGHGILLEDQLLLFLMKVHSIEEGLGFAVRGWSAVLVTNPQSDPSEWKMRWLACPQNRLNIVVGSGAVISSMGHVYAFGSKEPGPRHDIYLVRWQHGDVKKETLERIEWWCGEENRWSSKHLGADGAVPVMSGGQTEFTVHYDPDKKHFVQTQADGFGTAVIVQRTATDLTGPWSKKSQVFDPPQNKFSRIMIYQGKAHPYLKGAGQVLTYCTNSFKFSDHHKERWLYFPRFVRLNEGTQKNQ